MDEIQKVDGEEIREMKRRKEQIDENQD